MIEHLEQYSMAALCEGLRVSSSGFYAWRRHRHQRVCPLDQAVDQAFKAHGGRAGAPCLTGDVRAHGLQVSQRTVGRSLQRQGLRCRSKRKFRHTTDSKHVLPIEPNLLNRNFTATEPNQVWVGDITYIQTAQGWLYLAVMIDLFSRQVVGWQMSKRIDQRLVNDALQAALLTRGKPSGVMIHTDRGSQYCAKSFRRIIKDHQLVQSMSRKANCWDNAVAESFFATLKKQCVYGYCLTTHDQMRLQVFEFIEHYYNRVRRHSANNWITPVEFERLYAQNLERRFVYLND
jgi:transposase InsO family protein